MGCGELCVVLVGTPEMLLWCAGNLDTKTHVSETSTEQISMSRHHRQCVHGTAAQQVVYISGSGYLHA